MNASSDNDAVGLVVERPADQVRSIKSTPVPDVDQVKTEQPNRDVYHAAALATVPRCRRILGSAPWLDEWNRTNKSRAAFTETIPTRLAAAATLAVISELDTDTRSDGIFRASAGAAITGWQLGLRRNGAPVGRRSRRSPHLAIAAAFVIETLQETTGFDTSELHGDIKRHLRWLTTRTWSSPQAESSLVQALADGGLLIRDADLIETSRRRLGALLTRQDAEGWFPENGGADIGRLSLTVDSLARLYHHHGWRELREPLERALRFLIHFVHPDGSAGGGYGTCATGFVSPIGFELLAAHFPEAATLALASRRWAKHLADVGFDGWHDDLVATLGSRCAMASICAVDAVPASAPLPSERNGWTHFPHAGWSIFANDAYHAVVSPRTGGAISVTWRHGGRRLDDAGVTIMMRHAMGPGLCDAMRSEHRADGGHLVITGVLQDGSRTLAGMRRSMQKWLCRARMLTRRWRRGTNRPATRERRKLWKRRWRARTRRDIHFTPSDIIIRDRVTCHPRCTAVVCQSPPPRGNGFCLDLWQAQPSRDTPIFLEQLRHVDIKRTYHEGVLIDVCSQPGRSSITPNPIPPSTLTRV